MLLDFMLLFACFFGGTILLTVWSMDSGDILTDIRHILSAEITVSCFPLLVYVNPKAKDKDITWFFIWCLIKLIIWLIRKHLKLL